RSGPTSGRCSGRRSSTTPCPTCRGRNRRPHRRRPDPRRRSPMAEPTRPRILFVTGKLAEPALRRVLGELAPRAGFEAEVAVLPITVAALLTTDWVARHLPPPAGVDRVVLPGFCRGELGE